MTAFVIPNAIQMTTRQAKYVFASFLSRDTTFDVIFNIWRLARPGDSASITGSSIRGSSFERSVDQIAGAGVGEGPAAAVKSDLAKKGGAEVNLKHKPTQCACMKKGEHFSETALDMVVPGTPDRIYNLIFASGFIKDFLAVNQKLLGESLSLIHI